MRAYFRDYRRDWQRWSRAERIAAVILVLFVLAGASAALVKANSAHSQTRVTVWAQR